MKKYVIFDFDGTLVNTNDVVIASWQTVFRKYLGHELPVSEVVKTMGETLWVTLDRLLPGVDQDEAVATYRAFQNAHCKEMVIMCEGIKELLEELRARGFKMAIATSRTRKSYDGYAEQFGIADYFDAVVTMEDVIKHKPDPETCEAALRKLGALPEEAVFLGDTAFDIGCGEGAGVDTVFVAWSMTSLSEIEAKGYHPTMVIEKPMDLIDKVLY